MRRPLIWSAAAATGGIILADAFLPPLNATLLACFIAALLVASTFFLSRIRRAAWFRYAVAPLAMLLVAAIFGAWFTWRSLPGCSPELATAINDGTLEMPLIGNVADTPQFMMYPKRAGSFPSLRVPIAITSAGGVPCHGLIYLNGEKLPRDLEYGDEVALEVERVQPPRPPGNPGEFDYGKYLRRNGIAAAVYVREKDVFIATGNTSAWAVTRAALQFKRDCQSAADRWLTRSQSMILKCLVMGSTSDLEFSQQLAFRETGTLHLLTISGSHIAIVAGFVWLLAMLVGLGYRSAAACVIIAVLGYATLAGFAPSVTRSAIGCVVFCGGYLLMRKPDVCTSLALALLAVLALNPADLFNAGLQLSFVAVAGMVLFTDPLERALFRQPAPVDRLAERSTRNMLRDWIWWTLRKSISVSLAASLATMPLMAYHFQVFTPLCAPATLLLTPAVTVAMITGLPAMVLGPFIGAAAWPLFKLAAAGVWAMDWSARLLAALPGVAQYGPSPGPWPVLGMFAIISALAIWPERLWRPWRAPTLLLLPVALYFALVWHKPAPQFPQVHMVALGEANCIVVRFPDGRNLLFDAGGKTLKSGSQQLAPALWAVGVRRIDLAVLSHRDDDHCVGFEELARRIPVKCIALPEHFEANEKDSAWVAKLEKSWRVVRIARGDLIDGFPEATIRVLWPPRENTFTKMEPNELSAAVQIRTPQGSVLLTGDLAGAGALALATEEPDLASRVAQVPHHGRKDKSSSAFAAATHPELALVPGGKYESEKWQAHSGALLATGDCGMISVGLEPGRLRVHSVLQPTEKPTAPPQEGDE